MGIRNWKSFKIDTPTRQGKFNFSVPCVCETIYGDLFLSKYCFISNTWEIPVGIIEDDVIIFHELPKRPKKL